MILTYKRIQTPIKIILTKYNTFEFLVIYSFIDKNLVLTFIYDTP